MAMYVLDSTTKTIKVAMSAAAATTNPDYTVAYADNNGTAFTEGATDGVLNGTADVTVCSAPAASTRRIVKAMTINNRDTAAVTLYIKYDNAGTQRRLSTVTLDPNDSWTMDGVYDTYGNLKTNVSSSTPVIASVTGLFINGSASTLSVNGLNFGSTAVTVRFTYGATVADVSVTPVSTTSLNVSVPSTIYNLAGGTQGNLSVISTSGKQSNTFSKTIYDSTQLPAGGTISALGATRTHTFTSTGTFTIPVSFGTLTNAVAVVVGGGGAGGRSPGDQDTGKGGGGAGGVLVNTSLTLTTGTYSIVVGAGGTGQPVGPYSGGTGNSGSNSSAFSVQANGGGGGGASDGSGAPASGGSGGGAGARNNSSNDNGAISNQGGYSGWTAYGNRGGNAGGGGAHGGGGGGGAGGVGSAGSSNTGNAPGGIGGPGVDLYTYFGSQLGVNGWVGGGGGGGSYSTSSVLAQSSGGQGGGGNGTSAKEASQGGGSLTSGINGTAYTGGGGGGSSEDANSASPGGASSGNGGSGVVVIKYTLNL